MSAAITIVKRALNVIGAQSEVNPADPELIEIGNEQLQNLLQEFIEDQVYVGKTLTSLTSSSTTATATLADHGMVVGQTIYVNGADQTAYNGEFTVVATPTANTFTYTIAETATTPATGEIQAVAIPDTTGEEVMENRGASMPMEYLLAERMAAICRVQIPAASARIINRALPRLKQRFQRPTIPTIVPSKLLPRGQGSSRGQWPQNWFNGQTLDLDTSTADDGSTA